MLAPTLTGFGRVVLLAVAVGALVVGRLAVGLLVLLGRLAAANAATVRTSFLNLLITSPFLGWSSQRARRRWEGDENRDPAPKV